MFQLNSTRIFEECATTTLHLFSVPRICERPATKITLLPTCTSELGFFSRSRAPLMSQNTHLSLRPIQTIYLCQSMTGTCLIKISDVLTLCMSEQLQDLIDQEHCTHSHTHTHTQMLLQYSMAVNGMYNTLHLSVGGKLK